MRVPRCLRQFSNPARKTITAHHTLDPTAEVCRKHGVSAATFYKWKGEVWKWKAKFGGLGVSDARRLKALENENSRLKRMLAEAMLDNVALKDPLGKKW